MHPQVLPYNPRLKEFARQLRRNMTLAEVLLWKQLKGRQLMGLDFDRQRPIGEFIVDFYCRQLRLAIEIDGRIHDYTSEQDARRDTALAGLGVHVIRVWDHDVKTDMRGALRGIEDWVRQEAGPTPAPPEEGTDAER